MSSKGFSVRIFLQDGHSDGVKVVARSGWSGRCLVIPNSCIEEELRRKELNAPGVYLLLSPKLENEFVSLFIGAGEPLSMAIKESLDPELPLDQVVVFSSKDDAITMTQMHHLAMRLRSLVQSCKGVIVVGQSHVRQPILSATEYAEAESFLSYLLSICPLLGLRMFEGVSVD